MPVAHLNPVLLRWALVRAGKEPSELAAALKQPPEKVEGWLAGESRPTFKQAQNIARRLWVPFGYLFLSAPPAEPLPLKDFRRLPGGAETGVSVDLRAVVYDVLRKQDWYRDYRLDDDGSPVPAVGAYAADAPVSEVAAGIAGHLSLGTGADYPDADRFLREFVRKAEAAGVLVMRNGVVGHNPRRPLNVEEFRGFSISDPLAPVVFINAADSVRAQLFTLAHELAHIWVGAGGISDADLTIDVDHQTSMEEFCNAVAGQVLLPWDLVRDSWADGKAPWPEWVRKVARRFRLSTVMVARRLWEEQAIERDQFFAFYEAERSNWPKKRTSTGGDFYRIALIRNSRLFTEAVLADLGSVNTSIREASRLLGVKPAKLPTLKEKMGGRAFDRKILMGFGGGGYRPSAVRACS